MSIRLIITLLLLFAAPAAQAVSLVISWPDARQSYAQTPGNITTDPSWHPYSTPLKNDNAQFWYSVKVIVQHDTGEIVSNPLAISVRLNGVYDFYWDDEMIGSNKYQGKSASQFSRVFIPVTGLAEGEHQLKMHVNALGIRAGDSSDLQINIAALKSNFFGVHPMVISTFFIATATLFLAGYLIATRRTGGQRPGTTAAIILSIAILLAVLLAEGRFLFKYPYSWQPILEALQPPFALMFFAFLPWFILTRLNFPNRLWWMAVAPLSVAISVIDIGTIEQHIRAFFIVSAALLIISLIGWRRGQSNAKFFAAGLGVAFIALVVDPERGHLFLIVITVLVASDLALDMRRQSKDAVRLLVMSERLKADLIKRNVQPHFLMNSLTALMEWVETSPDDAVQFIDGLAQEFRILSDFSDRRSVSLKEELSLCNIHIALMGQRLTSQLTLDTDGINPDQQVPPALFHTLVENAFSHNDYRALEASFSLSQQVTEDGMLFRLSVPVVHPRESGQSVGLGTRYIEARLEEFCGSAFRFQSQMIGSNWVSEITFKKV